MQSQRQPDDLSDNPRVVNISEYEGNPIGVAVFISSSDLAELGINVEVAESLEFWVENNSIHVDAARESEQR